MRGIDIIKAIWEHINTGKKVKKKNKYTGIQKTEKILQTDEEKLRKTADRERES